MTGLSSPGKYLERKLAAKGNQKASGHPSANQTILKKLRFRKRVENQKTFANKNPNIESDGEDEQQITSSSSDLEENTHALVPRGGSPGKERKGRRIISPSSAKTKTKSTKSSKSLSHPWFEDHYPTFIDFSQLDVLERILEEQQPLKEKNPARDNVQAAFAMDPQTLLRTISLTSKSDEEVVSVLVRRPTVSGLIFFKTETDHFDSNEEPSNNMDENRLELSRSEFLSHEEASELEKRTVFRTYFASSSNQQSQMNERGETNTTDQIEEELVFLENLLHFKKKENYDQIKTLKEKIAEEGPPPNYAQIDQINNQFMVIAFQKNIARGMIDRPLETLNHFKLKASLEEHRPYEPNLTIADLADFIGRKRIRKNKKTKSPLTTSCLCCFSDFSEQSNPLSACYECGVRSHRLCKAFENSKCSACDARHSKKVRIRECVLCPTRGLPFRRCGEFNVHVYCILVFGYYSVQKLQPVTETANITAGNNRVPCFCCGQSVGKLIKCSSCDRYGHPTCCYLAGYLMSPDSRKTVTFDCEYYTPEELEHNRFNRLYRANYNKYAYKYLSYEQYVAKARKRTSVMQVEGVTEEGAKSILPAIQLELDDDVQSVTPNLY